MSPTIYILITAFSLGVLGSTHCAAMCGGFAGSLQRNHKISGEPSTLKVALLFNTGRLLSYAFAGVVASLFGASIVHLLGPYVSKILMQWLVGGFLIMLGLNLAGWLNGLGWIEKGGQYIWRLLNPLARYVSPVDTVYKAIGAGALWGWLPCGLVYSALALVVGSGQPMIGASAMILFGLGTMPMLVFIGAASNKVQLVNKPTLRKWAGTSIIVFGSLIFTGIGMTNMTHH